MSSPGCSGPPYLADRWRLADVTAEVVVFRSILRDPSDEEQTLEVSAPDVKRLTWDRLTGKETEPQTCVN